jgi:hypothetical protein
MIWICDGEGMASLWQFFGLPDPDGQSDGKKSPRKAKRPTLNTPDTSLTGQRTLESKVETKPPAEKLTEQPIKLEAKKTAVQAPKALPQNWTGPITAEGEAFHDLGAHLRVQNSFPRRALRYVSPDKMNRIPTREMAKRILQGDSIIVDLRPMVHMDTHQNVCRRELQQMSNETGVGVFALDAEDKLLLLPGKDVVVDVGKHELGLLSLMSE